LSKRGFGVLAIALMVFNYLFRYVLLTLGKSWRKCENLPYALAASPTPCPVIGDEIYLLGGDEWKFIRKNPAQPNIQASPNRFWSYNKNSDTWTQSG
jgi:hypothetical protein